MALDLADPRLLLSDAALEDPAALHDLLRSEAPVWHLPGTDAFVVADPALIKDAVSRTEDFSSNLVSLLHDDGTGCPAAMRIAPLGDPIHVLATADPPAHTRHRKLLQPHLSPAALTELHPAIERIVHTQLDTMLGTDRSDAVADFADPVPVRTICELIGLPEDHLDRVLELVAGTGALLDGVGGDAAMSTAARSALELAAFVEEHLELTLETDPRRRRRILAVFAEGISAGVVDRGEARDTLVVLVTAGSETTASLIATTIDVLARDRALADQLRGAPEQLPRLLEEVLRRDGPFQFHYRHVTRDCHLGGVELPAGATVLLMWAAANRPTRADEPQRDLCSVAGADGRTAPHFAFGRGLHFCIGAPLARLESRLAIEALLARTSSIQLDASSPPVRRPSIFIHRYASLAVQTR